MPIIITRDAVLLLRKEAGIAVGAAVLAAFALFLSGFAGIDFMAQTYIWSFAVFYGGRLLVLAFQARGRPNRG